MIDDLKKIWDLLDTLVKQPTDQLKVREVPNPELAAGRVLLGSDINRYKHLLIPVARNTKIVTDQRSNGVQIVTHPLIDNGSLRFFVDFVCLKPHLEELFSILVNEVLELLKEDPSRPDQTCRIVLNRWRELLEREPSSAVSQEKLIGLFGELWFLHEMVQKDCKAVQYWIGPKGTRHDFSVGNLAIEIKSTLLRNQLLVGIHGHEQLEQPDNGQLYLLVLRLEQISSGLSLKDLVDSIVLLGGDRFTLLSLLSQANVDLHTLEEYKDQRFLVYEYRVYEVDVAFPRITPKSFVDGNVPRGVLKINYQIDLTLEPPIPLSNNVVAQLYNKLGIIIGEL